ncbi:hypothetical protein RYO59_001195 [Thermosynechococcaceae cyanobacterium Okahandja]
MDSSSSNPSVTSQEPIPASEDPCHRWCCLRRTIAQMSPAYNLNPWD